MISEYTIISINESRAQKKQAIRSSLSINEVFIDCVNGSDSIALRKAKEKWSNVEFPGPFKAGEFGIFFSLLNAWEYAAENNGLLVFEDDAILIHDFEPLLHQYLEGLPADADFVAIWTPNNQQGDYYRVSSFNSVGEPQYEGPPREFHNSIFYFGHEHLSKVWNGYGGVCLYFTKQGGQKLIEYAEKMGMFTPADCFMYIAAHSGYVNGYGLNPNRKLVEYDWNAPTTIHKTRWGSLEELINE